MKDNKFVNIFGIHTTSSRMKVDVSTALVYNIEYRFLRNVSTLRIMLFDINNLEDYVY